MIPERIYVKGFLCYRDAQEACFDGCSLWLLSGPNGSGKSALFDAVTYSLYGQHRAGRNNARGLINHKCEGFTVAFDFRTGDRRFRAQRSLSRHAGPSRQMYEWTGTVEAAWRPVPDTRSEQGFIRWVNDNLGLSYDTFTASVLLLQGRTDNLLHVGPAKRHDLLSQVVGLERYHQLFKRATRHLSRAQGALAKLHEQLRKTPKVSQRQLSKVRHQVEAELRREEEATSRVQQLSARQQQAEQWEQLVKIKSELELQISDISRLLLDESAVKEQHERWELLSNQIEKLSAMESTYLDCVNSQRALDKLEKKKVTLERNVDKLIAEASKSSRAVCDAEQSFESAAALVHDLSGRQILAHRAGSILDQLRRARQQEQAAAESIRRREHHLENALESRKQVAANAPSKEDLHVAAQRLTDTTEGLAQFKASYQQVEQSYARFVSVSRAPVCGYCQQPLPKSHVTNELPKLTSQLSKARTAFKKATDELARARVWTNQLEEKREGVSGELSTLDCRVIELNAEIRSLRNQQSEAIQKREAALRELSLTGSMTESEAGDLADQGPTLSTQLKAAQNELRRAREMLRQLRSKRESDANRQHLAAEELRELDHLVAQRRGELAQLRRVVGSKGGGLSALLRDSTEPIEDQIQRLKSEHDAVKASELSERYAEIRVGRLKYERLVGRLAGVVQSIEQIPNDARRAGVEISKALGEARVMRDDAKGHLHEALRKRTELQDSARRRQLLGEERRRADREQHLWNRLGTLIGRDGLICYLIRNAEHEIVDYANAILDRLSAGNLYLELRERTRCGADKALDLLVRIGTSNGELQEVAFLSGSQKFRVAVSLSLAIGQYASRTRRPVQAVIIDEGFGCLDSVNRQVMIHELDNLKNYLARVVIVSHQEEFAAAFSDRFRTQFVDGTVKLTQCHDD